MQSEQDTHDVVSETAETETPPAARRSRFRFWQRQHESGGQAIVEFAIVSIAFFMIVFGTIDFGRAIFMYSQLHNAVQEGARYGKSQPYDWDGIRNTVIADATSFDLSAGDVTPSCRDKNSDETSCSNCAKLQVEATASFSAITQDFLGIDPIKLTATAKVATE